MKYYVRELYTDEFIGEVNLEKEPEIGKKIKVAGKGWRVKDKSIGQRKVDELYVIGPVGYLEDC